MLEWISNGAQLAWLIDPVGQSVAIYRADGAVETLSGIESIEGDGVVTGFLLELSAVWNPLGI